MNSGFLNVIKPDGLTSFQVIAKVRKKFGIKKVGHMGTLDPAGVGVLPLAIGKATKLFDLMQNKTKTYYAIFVFGKQTDTLDSFGIVDKIDVNCNISSEQINVALKDFIGEIDQLPPKFSAKKINGKRAYDLARCGEEFELLPKRIKIDEFDLVEQIDANKYLFKIVCSSGTYIRSLCRDLAYKLNTVAYMPLIIRSNVEDFNLENGVTLVDLLDSDNPQKYIIPIDSVYKLDKIELDELNAKKLRNGLSVKTNALNGKYYLYDNNKLFAIGNAQDKLLKMEIYLDD